MFTKPFERNVINVICWTPKNHVKDQPHVNFTAVLCELCNAAWSPKNSEGKLCAYQTTKRYALFMNRKENITSVKKR